MGSRTDGLLRVRIYPGLGGVGVDASKATDEGRELLGGFNNNIWSTSLAAAFYTHTVTASNQRNNVTTTLTSCARRSLSA